MENISTFGLSAYITASRTLPVGLLLNKFADDADSIGVTEVENGQAILDLNGKVIRWTVANPLVVSLAIIPGSIDDDTLAVIYNANRASRISVAAGDSINLVVRYPNGGIRTFTSGRIIAGPSAPTARAEGRMASNIYTFAFGDQYALTTAAVASAIAGRLDIFGRAADLLGV